MRGARLDPGDGMRALKLPMFRHTVEGHNGLGEWGYLC